MIAAGSVTTFSVTVAAAAAAAKAAASGIGAAAEFGAGTGSFAVSRTAVRGALAPVPVLGARA